MKKKHGKNQGLCTIGLLLIYEQFNLLDDLFPLTMSCIGFAPETNYFTEPCRKCYWCHEKKWAFGCYDGGLLE